ncbi:MAG: cytochrome c family protein [Myxococcales bacterium]|nr:cytochrome c family protein [Myxococcales bacterium]
MRLASQATARGVVAVAAVVATAAAAAALGAVHAARPSPPPRDPTATARGAIATPDIATPAAALLPPEPPGPFASNIRREDYVGPAVCGECHAEQHARWQGSLHAVMNQEADRPGAVAGDFGGVTVAYGGGRARFERDRGAPVMALTDARGVTRRYRVTRTIGARALQEYVGVLVGEGGEGAEGADGVERRLPFGWWLARPGWYPQPYFDAWFGAEHDAAGQPTFDAFTADPAPWATRCAWCHNTYPFELRLLRDPTIGHGPEAHVELVTTERAAAERARLRDDNLLPVDALVTVGVSCESCHLGGRGHADGEALAFAPVGPHVRRRADAPPLPPPGRGRDAPALVNALCAQCHSTPSPRYPDGSAVRNSTEALDLAAGACAGAIACTDCHDPHTRGAGAGAPDEPAHLAACTRCHAALADPAAAAAHGRHPPGAASCLDCHLPRLVTGVGAFVRSHRISSPGDPAMLAAGAPGACNLCHLDRSIRWTVDELRRGWGVALAPDAAWGRAYGDLDHPVGLAWLTRGAPPVRLAAAAAFARHGDRAALPALVAYLDDPVAHDRMWLLLAIEALLGRRLTAREYDPLAPPAVRARQARALAARAATGRLAAPR